MSVAKKTDEPRWHLHDHAQRRDFDIMSEHYRAIVLGSEDAIISKNLEGTITSWNAGAQALFGYSAEEMLGQSMMRLFPEDRKNEEIYILNRILAGEKIQHFETVRVHKDNRPLHVSVSISPIRDREGRIIGASNIARDISEHIDNENKARYHQAIVSSSDDAIVSKNLDGIVTSWNASAEAIFGYSAEEMIGQPLMKIIPSYLVHEEDMILAKIRRGEKIDHFETKRQHKNGKILDISVTISPIIDKTGRIVGASKIARDFTAQRQMEKRLRLISTVFTDTTEAVIIIDADYRIVEANASFSHISGYAKDEIVGENPFVFISGRDDGGELVEVIKTAMAERGFFQGEVWSRKKTGEPYAGLMTLNSVRSDSGEVENYIALITDITPLRLEQERLEHLANFDGLTNLPNRILFADRLQHAMALSQRHEQPLAVLYLDLDGFKEVNDLYGHDVGDRLLVDVSRAMNRAMRDGDTLARIGGDEFAAVLQDVNSVYDCSKLVERILDACRRPVYIDGHALQVSASIGVTMYPQDTADAEQLMRHADRAMYEAKQTGKNRYHVFDRALEDELRRRRQRSDVTRQALEREEFSLWYQPKVNMRTGAVFGVEALIRWNHPVRGLLTPAQFLPGVDDPATNQAIEKWVLETALKQMSDWKKMGHDELSMSINIGSRQLQQRDFAQRLERLLNRYDDVNPGDIELEILETSALQDMKMVSAVMRDCCSLGVRFSVDDFGTGYSSLTYLRRLPAEILKIDQSFIRGMLNNQEDMAIVEGILGLAAAFKRQVIAEGVETVEIGKKLLDMNCELAQGFGIAVPMPGSDVPDWISQWRPHASWH